MKLFWQWMKDKKYCSMTRKKFLYGINGNIEPVKQMLIGYMHEYMIGLQKKILKKYKKYLTFKNSFENYCYRYEEYKLNQDLYLLAFSDNLYIDLKNVINKLENIWRIANDKVPYVSSRH
jgi:hypothetical protein